MPGLCHLWPVPVEQNHKSKTRLGLESAYRVSSFHNCRPFNLHALALSLTSGDVLLCCVDVSFLQLQNRRGLFRLLDGERPLVGLDKSCQTFQFRGGFLIFKV